MNTTLNAKALLELARAYDREDAAQRGEPDPWAINDDGPWREERLACARAGMDAFRRVSPSQGEGPAADVVRTALEAAKELAKTAEALTGCRGDDDYVWSVQEKIAAALASLAPRAAQGAPADEQSGETSHVAVSDAMVEAAQNELGHFGIYASTPTVRAALTAAIGAGRQLSALAHPRPLKEEVERVLDREESALIRYRDEDCQGDDEVKRHAWIVADARLSEVRVVRNLLSRIRAGAQDGWRSQAAHDVLAERKRQVEVEGWTPEHDDAHDKGELAAAASCYAYSTASVRKLVRSRWAMGRSIDDDDIPVGRTDVPVNWPDWDGDWWKPSEPRRNLVKAGALILAEIERLDRAAPSQEAKGGPRP